MAISRVTLQVISGLLAIVPIVIGLRALRFDKSLARAFVIFLTVGIVTDVSMGMIVSAKNIPLATVVFQCYSLFEALTFLWFVHRLSDIVILKHATRYIAYVVPMFWAFCMFFVPRWAGFNYGSAIFDSTYEVLIAFLTGLSILKLAEDPNPLFDRAAFWLLFALFFYCFGTFFIMLFVKTFLSQRIWFINNIVNVLTYALYSVGLWRLSSVQKKEVKLN